MRCRENPDTASQLCCAACMAVTKLMPDTSCCIRTVRLLILPKPIQVLSCQCATTGVPCDLTSRQTPNRRSAESVLARPLHGIWRSDAYRWRTVTNQYRPWVNHTAAATTSGRTRCLFGQAEQAGTAVVGIFHDQAARETVADSCVEV